MHIAVLPDNAYRCIIEIAHQKLFIEHANKKEQINKNPAVNIYNHVVITWACWSDFRNFNKNGFGRNGFEPLYTNE